MALQKARDRINVRGGGLLKIRQIAPTPSDTFTDLGFLHSTGWEDAKNMLDIIDERGFVVDYSSGADAPILRAVLKQSGIDEINLLKNADGIYYEIYYYAKTASGKFQEFDIPLAKIKPGLVLNFASATERTLEVEFHILAVNATGTVTRNPTGYNLDTSVSMYYVVVENAAALGAPVDTGTAVKTAVF